MKPLLSLITCFILIISSVNSQTLNEGFENWSDTLSSIAPTGWGFTWLGIDTIHKNLNRVPSINEGEYAVNLRSSIPTTIEGYHGSSISKRLPVPSNKITISLTYKCEGYGFCYISVSQGFQDSVVYPGQTLMIIPAGDTTAHSIVLKDITVDPGSEIFRFITFFAQQGFDSGYKICSFTIDSLNVEMEPLITATHSTIKEEEIYLYPNPTTSEVFLSSKPKAPWPYVEVYNAHGQLILAKKNTIAINLQDQANGFYYFKIYSGNSMQTSKVLKVNK